jgi:hypothetical protein
VTTPRPARTLGAYALAPTIDDAHAVEEFYDGLRTLEIDAIEHPLMAAGHPSLEPAWQRRHLHDWQLVVTAIPRTMVRLGQAAGYGLASSDEDGRLAALADLAEVRDLALRLADDAGRPRVLAVEVHSAPAPTHASARGVVGSAGAFARSLAEIAAWDLAGAQIVIEHNDALVDGQEPAKGFFPLADEIAVAHAVGDPAGKGAAVGVSVNWGRSAIEGRSASAPLAHTRAAAAAGVLRGIIFSGATDQESAWGTPWDDGHIAPRGDDPTLAASSASLLGLPEMRATLAAAGDVPLTFVGAKVTTQPPSADVTTRLAVASATLALLTEATHPHPPHP